MEDSKTIAGYFAEAFKERLERRETFGAANAVNLVRESGKQAIAETAADLAIEQTDQLVKQIKEDSAEIIKTTSEKLSPEIRDSWEIIRDNIAPQGGFFRTIFARLLWIGAKVTSFVGALVVDRWTGRDEKDINKENLDTIFAWLMGWIFKKNPNSQTQEQRSPLLTRKPGVPKSWLSSAPTPA